ncbi:MAG TPA: ABC transporter permease [Oligoflexus sp.]|uniref:ABC transporter permease n=1 Tax=Oligoflexus sp. TaxID=1971216 RepID=UPI002D35A335|nr:ABC transporter permease [Oligoflexus sp.]HYX33393.1 ABC transporter permease [Oligoflexus sp.]
MYHLLRRFGFYALAGWLSLTINFFLPRLAPGDPASLVFARFQGQMKPESLEALKQVFGLTDAPLYQQYFTYLKHMLQGDFGISVVYYPARVVDVIGQGFQWTLLLAGTAVVISFVLGTGLGIVAAARRGSWFDSILPPVLAFFGAFPYFWLAMLLLYVFAFRLGWFPLGHAMSDRLADDSLGTKLYDVISHAFLPALSIVLATVGGWMLSMRNAMMGALGQDYVGLAEAKGLSRFRIIWRYAARNALLPNMTGFGMALGFVMGGSLLTEVIFSYPGQGFLLVQAVRSQDFPLMQGLFLMITTAVLLANWLVDLFSTILDPRIRLES